MEGRAKLGSHQSLHIWWGSVGLPFEQDVGHTTGMNSAELGTLHINKLFADIDIHSLARV